MKLYALGPWLNNSISIKMKSAMKVFLMIFVVALISLCCEAQRSGSNRIGYGGGYGANQGGDTSQDNGQDAFNVNFGAGNLSSGQKNQGSQSGNQGNRNGGGGY